MDAVSVCNDLAAIKIQLKELLDWKSGLNSSASSYVHDLGVSMKNSEDRRIVPRPSTSSDKSVKQVNAVNGSEATFAKVVASETHESATGTAPSKYVSHKPVKKNVGTANTSSLRVGVRRRSFDLYFSGLEPGESADKVAEAVKGRFQI